MEKSFGVKGKALITKCHELVGGNGRNREEQRRKTSGTGKNRELSEEEFE